ncbi:MAG: hypothetical protein PHF56_00735 [Desulfuromonadaceae bacterium]|nr:hypothetical protein [Desulfuromonadaceae bacterium]
MHKGTHRSREEYQDDSDIRSFNLRSFKNRRRVDRERDEAEQYKGSARNSQWVFGNFFECFSGNEICPHGRVPFGGSFYCIWPLKDASPYSHRKPPCSWDAENAERD